MSHFRWTQSSGGGAVTHRYLLAAKQSQAPPPLFGSSFRQLRYQQTSPQYPLFYQFLIQSFSPDPHLLPLFGSSSLHPFSPIIRFSFTTQKVPVNLSLFPAFCTGLHLSFLSWLLCTLNLSHTASCFYLKHLYLNSLVFFNEVLLFKDW